MIAANELCRNIYIGIFKTVDFEEAVGGLAAVAYLVYDRGRLLALTLCYVDGLGVKWRGPVHLVRVHFEGRSEKAFVGGR